MPPQDPVVSRAKTVKQGKTIDEKVDATLDRLLVEFGREILAIVPGKVSTEVDARFSFDTQGSVDKARHIIEVRKDCLWQKSAIADHCAALQVHRYRQVSRPDQNRFHLGGYQGGRDLAEGGH